MNFSKTDNASTHADHLSQWIGKASATSDTDQEILDPENGSLASRLYASCMQVLQGICARMSASKAALYGVNVQVLKEELVRLYLLGEGLDNGRLDKALQDADDLRETFLEVLASIGRLLMRGECQYFIVNDMCNRTLSVEVVEYDSKEILNKSIKMGRSAPWRTQVIPRFKGRCALDENCDIFPKCLS